MSTGSSSSVSISESDLPSTSSDGNVDAEQPFDSSAKADIILRSIDSIDFFVLKTILSLASPAFDDMFIKAQENSKTKNGLPVVDFAEDGATLYNLLLLAYPYAQGPTSTLEMYMKVGMAAKKYAMGEVLKRLENLVGTCEAIANQPLGVFAIAVHFGWLDVMRNAAWDTLAVPLCDLTGGDELQRLTGTDFVDLLQWRFACQRAVDKLLSAKIEQSHTGFTTHTPGQRALAESLRERLKETGCPHGAVLMNDSIIARGLESPARQEPSPSNGLFGSSTTAQSSSHFVPQKLQAVLETAKKLEKDIDIEVSEIPLMVRNQWIVAPPKPTKPNPTEPKPSEPRPVAPEVVDSGMCEIDLVPLPSSSRMSKSITPLGGWKNKKKRSIR